VEQLFSLEGKINFIFSNNEESFRSHHGPGVDSASNRNEHQKYFLVEKTAGA
jgi:hypothetical protein